MHWIVLGIGVLLFVACYRVIWRRASDFAGDDVIDELIANRGYRFIPGMEEPDLSLMNGRGDDEWERTCRAQAHLKRNRVA